MISGWILIGSIAVQEHCSKKIDTEANKRNASVRHAGSQDGTAWSLCLVKQDFAWFALSHFFRGVHAIHLIHDCCKVCISSDIWTNHVIAVLLSYKLCGYILNAFWVLFPFLECACVWDIEGTEVLFQSNFQKSWAGISWWNCRRVTGKQSLGETC